MQQGDHTNAAAPKAPSCQQVLMCITAIPYALLVVTGTTTSSLGVAHLNQDGAAGDSHLGELQGIRSDEYNVAAPVQLSMLATGSEPALSPLGAEASIIHRYPVGPVQTSVFWDALPYKLGPVLPDAQLFAAHWWLPTLLLMLCMQARFHLIGGSRAIGWLAAIVVAVAPANFWVTHLASSSELADASCLSPKDSVQWNGTTYTVFMVQPSPEQSRADGE